jgi:8-oxo-dGTP diphosphatase
LQIGYTGPAGIAMPMQAPLLTVDIIIECSGGIVLIERKNPPHGWALPGGFVDIGETIEQAAIREAKEETSLDIRLIEQMHTYSDPYRDPRHHTVSTVFIATAQQGAPKAADDAKNAAVHTLDRLPSPLVFDHAAILRDYRNYKKGRPRLEIFGYDRTTGTT